MVTGTSPGRSHGTMAVADICIISFPQIAGGSGSGGNAPDLHQAARKLEQAAAAQAQGNSAGSSAEVVSELRRLRKAVSALESKLDESIELGLTQTLLLAVAQAGTNGFHFFERSNSTYAPAALNPALLNSTDLVRYILLDFNRGHGRWISNSWYCEKDNVAGQQAFRDNLSAQIHALTGQKPRFDLQMNGTKKQWAIFRT